MHKLLTAQLECISVPVQRNLIANFSVTINVNLNYCTRNTLAVLMTAQLESISVYAQ